MLPKAELHVHLEGTITPSLVRKFIKRNKLSQIENNLFNQDDTYRYHSFLNFLQTYDLVAETMLTPQDYYDTVYEYLNHSSKSGVVYTEIMASPEHAARNGLSYQDHLMAIVNAIDGAREQCGIEARIIVVGTRNFGQASCENLAKEVAKYPHKYVVGFGLAGDEAGFPPQLFTKAYQIASDAGLGLTAHAGEMAGPASVKNAIDFLHVSRIGHGVRSIEDNNLIAEIIDKGITLECSPGSNIALGVYKSYDEHPLRKLFEKGVKVTLNSDDPPFFRTTIAQEYETAQKYFEFNKEELLKITRTSIENSFADESTKKTLLKLIKKASF